MAPLLDGSCGGADGSEPVRLTGLYTTLVVTGVLMFVATAITFVDVAGVVKIVVLGALLVSVAVSVRAMVRFL